MQPGTQPIEPDRYGGMLRHEWAGELTSFCNLL